MSRRCFSSMDASSGIIAAGHQIDFFFLTSGVPYFFRNFSTRPALSMNFCLPVKKGWQLEQISTRISFLVDRVWKVLPQAQITVQAS
jgi:hypothetical protein